MTPVKRIHLLYLQAALIIAQAAQTLFVIYIRDSIALRVAPFKRMYENASKIALNSTCSKGLNKEAYLSLRLCYFEVFVAAEAF